MALNLRKLIKYEERLGVSSHRDDYFESLFRRTTASYRSKNGRNETLSKRRTYIQEDDVPTTSKNAQSRQRILQERNRQRGDPQDSTSTSDYSNDLSPATVKNRKLPLEGLKHDSRKSIVNDMVSQILNDKLKNSQENCNPERNLIIDGQKLTILDENTLRPIIADLVNRVLKVKFTQPRGLNESAGKKPFKSIVEDIVTEYLKKHLTCSEKNKQQVQNLNSNMRNVSIPNRSLESEALMAELLGDTVPKSKDKQRSPQSRSRTPEWTQMIGDKSNSTGIKRMPRTQEKAPEWQQMNDKSKPSSSVVHKEGRSRSPAASSSARSSRPHSRGRGVLIPRSISRGRSNKPHKSDPVALYQYYKNEWEHFREQIPGEDNRNRLRWHVRQRFLDIDE